MKRIIWIDYAKVIGIFLVILAHLYTSEGTDSTNIVRTFIYGFHMPFFFLISGCLYKARDGGLVKALTLNIKKLLIPYISLNIFFAIVYGIISADPISELIKFPRELFFGGGTPCRASWFVIALFFIKCIYDLLFYSKIEKIAVPIIFLITILINYMSIKHNFFYYKSVLIGICFFHLGRLCFSTVNKYGIKTLTSFILSVSLFIVSYYLSEVNGKVSLLGGKMGNNSLLFYTNAIVGSLGVISMSFLTKKRSNTISEISNASIAVVLLHMIFVQGTLIVVSHFNISGLALFIVYAIFSIIIYYLCFMIFRMTNQKIPYIWGK